MTETIASVAHALLQKEQARRGAPPGTYRAEYCGPCRQDCQECGGTGLVRLDVPAWDHRFGKLSPCPNVPVQHRNTRWRNGLTLNEENDLRWSSFAPLPITVKVGAKAHETTTDKIALRVRDYLNTHPWGWIWLYAQYGLAKSMILKCAVAEELRRGRPAVYITASELLDDLRAAFDTKDPSESALRRINEWVELPFLALDEFDKINATSWVNERLFQLMDRRHQSGIDRQSITLLASNRLPEEIDLAIASRARDGRYLFVELVGKDARPGMTDEDLF